MRLALTGTPGTGKTTVADRLADDLPVVHLNDVIEREELWTRRDDDRDSLVADLDAIESWLDREGPADDHVVESHLAHHLPADRVVVLRCHPAELSERLRDRDVASASVAENAESEALDVVLAEAVDAHEAVHELDTTGRDPEDVAGEVRAIIDGDRDPSVGDVDFTGWL